MRKKARTDQVGGMKAGTKLIKKTVAQARASWATTGIVVSQAGLVLVMVLLGACAPGVTAMPAGRDLSPQYVTITSLITPIEFRFQPTELRVRANVPVHLSFDNRLQPGSGGGALPHDFTIDNISRQGLLSRLAGYRVHVAVAADSQATGEFQLPPGTYEFYCSVDRHALDGMVGTVIATE